MKETGLGEQVKWYLGTSGFSYPSWKEKFYPKELKNDEFLSYYAKHLNSVEINSSFYAAPSQTMVRSWNGKTGDSFRFAFKAPRQITHILKLEGKPAVDASEKLEQTLEGLGAKNGPLLFQLPPYLRQNLSLLESFLQNTSKIQKRVFEFRHETWLNQTTYLLLDKYGAGFCVADTEDMQPVFNLTGGLAYFRLRKDKYSEKEIEDATKKIRDTVKNASEAYVFLRHDETGDNVSLALKMMREL